MGALDDVENNDKEPQQQQQLELLEPGRAAAISRQLHTQLLPIFLLMSCLCYLDRTNSAFAALQMTHDLKFDAETYGLGSGLFFVGYSFAMIPSQFILMQVGAPRWLACIVTTWGVTAMAFAFMKNKVQFFVLRLLLGISESGAFPGMWYYLNSFYPPDQVTLPYSLVEAAVGMANVVAAPLAASLLLLDGKNGMHGWQWLFLVEGLPSVATGIAMAYTLPRDFHSCSFLSNSDKAWLAQALASHKKHSQEAEAQGFWWLLLDASRNRRIWLTGLAALLKNAAMVGILFWAPIIVNTLLKGGAVDLGATAAAAAPPMPVHGHHRHLAAAADVARMQRGGAAVLLQQQPWLGLEAGVLQLQHPRALLDQAAGVAAAAVSTAANVGNGTLEAAAAAVKGAAGAAAAAAGGSRRVGDRGVAAVLLTAVPFICAAGCAVWLGHRSQLKREKCKHVAVPYALAALLFVLFPSVASLGGTWAFLCLTAAIASLTAPNAILNSLASSVSAGPSSAISLALYNSVGNLGGLVGPYLIGRVVKATGLYATALQALGTMVGVAAALAFYMRRWNV